MAHVPLWLQDFYQHFKGNILVSIGIQGNLTDALQQLTERWLARQITAHDKGVDKEADEPLYFGSGAVGNGGTNTNILLMGVAVQQHVNAVSSNIKRVTFSANANALS